MQHSVKWIGQQYQFLSEKRNDNYLFNATDFFNFAKLNKDTYSLIENGDDLLVSTWYSDSLINTYKSTIKPRSDGYPIIHS